jgi:DNA-binding transcriptional regulator GbsR (MarR family)
VLPGDRPADVVAFEAALVDFFVDAADLLGVPKSVAAIYGIVFASPEPLSFAEIDARLDISKGSISQGLRVLRDVGALKEVSAKTDRAELFTPDVELRKLIQRFLEQRLQKQLESGKSRLTSLSRSVPAFKPADAETLRTRLKYLQAWHDKARALLPIAKTFLKLTPL